MKNLILFLLLISGFAFGQKIREDKIDKFSKKRTVKTSYVELTKSKGFLVPNDAIAVNIVMEQENVYLHLLWYSEGYALNIYEGDKFVFLDSEGVSYDFTTAGSNQFERVKQSMTDAFYYKNYVMLKGDLSQFQDKKITDIRFVQNGKYQDFVVPEKYQNELSKLYKVFSNHIEKK
ncbi:hypothetical protein [Epilithonimonas xixisoli]|uniref:Uncharacterized protein n=1 Tax=Epilithonimonas xixisoli TaxID=1476462 RepID=A0A4R8IEW1_9FLAO|nr:hypothetical protein [Epilithonimonas xixisoli]TDX83934.1 hypothetical protein B0I22_1522 [Epilithonimonas xixisoli]